MMGFTFKTIHNSSIGIVVTNITRGIKSADTRFVQQVPGKPGTYDFGNDTAGEISHKVECYATYNPDNLNELRLIERDLRGLIYNDGNYYDLIFDDEPDRKYKAKVTSALDSTLEYVRGKFTVEFTCNPPYPFLLDNTPVTDEDEATRLLWDTMSLSGIQYIQTLSADGTIRFTVGGSASVKPIIKIYGYIEAGLNLTYGSGAWQYDADLIYDGIIIDCENETVLRASDGANLFGNVNIAYDDYFNLATGQQSITVTGVNGVYPTDLTIAIEFTPVGA